MRPATLLYTVVKGDARLKRVEICVLYAGKVDISTFNLDRSQIFIIHPCTLILHISSLLPNTRSHHQHSAPCSSPHSPASDTFLQSTAQ